MFLILAGVQYAVAMGYRVIAIDLVDAQLKDAKSSGAEHIFNPVNDKDYIKQIIEITDGGCHAAVNYTNSKPAYDSTPPLLRAGGIMMVVGIPQKGITLNALEIALGKYRVGAASNGVPQHLGPCLDFSAKHNIKPHCTFYKIEQVQEMIDRMHNGKAVGRLAIAFE